MVKTRVQIACNIAMKIILFFITLIFFQCTGTMESTEHKIEDLGEDMKDIYLSDNFGAKGNPKMSSSLNQLLEAYRKGGINEAEAFAKKHLMVLDKASVQVSIMTTEGAVGDVLDAVESVGGEFQIQYKNRLQVFVPIGMLEELAHRSDILIIREPRRAVTN
jgi:hypothetical protein